MDSDSSDDYLARKKRSRTTKPVSNYVDTVNRYVLDFDFEKVCSVTLSNVNIYVCLVCGKFFQGRGKDTPVYIHSMENEHHLFMNLNDAKVWSVPDNYEVLDDSLHDIKYNLNPKFTKDQIAALPESGLSLLGSEFYPGLVGLNQIKDDSYLNSVIHALCPVVPLRDTLLLLDSSESKLVSAYSDLVKKINNPNSFKGLVSPHEFLQVVSITSGSEFFTSAADPFKFLEWFLPNIQAGISERVVFGTFQGKSTNGSFLSIGIDLPVMPVFKEGSTLIPSIPMVDLLAKRFSNESIIKLPPYLVVKFNRFVKNNFFLEKNSTLVQFPLTGVDFSPYLTDNKMSGKYNLVSTICHEGKSDSGSYKAFVLHPVSHQWFDCNGIRVKKTSPQNVASAESYIQIWKLQ